MMKKSEHEKEGKYSDKAGFKNTRDHLRTSFSLYENKPKKHNMQKKHTVKVNISGIDCIVIDTIGLVFLKPYVTLRKFQVTHIDIPLNMSF